MNVVKASAGNQAAFQKETGQTVKAELGKFDGQLSAAQGKQGWLQNTEMFMSEERKQMDELEKSQKQKSFERQQANAELALAMASTQKISTGRNQANIAESTALSQSMTKQSSGQMAAGRFNQTAEQLKGSAADAVMEQKSMERKGHLFNPGLAQAQSEGANLGKETKSMTESAGTADPKASKGENQQFTQSDEQSTGKGAKKGAFNMANYAQKTSDVQNPQVQPVKFNEMNAIKAQGQLKASSAAATAPKQVAAAAKPSGPAPVQAVAAGTGTLKQTEKAAKEAPIQRATPQVDVKEVAGNVKIMINRAQDEMTMKLNPQHLGKLEIRLKKDGDHMIANLKVESLEAKHVLEQQLPELKESLSRQGIDVASFDITLAEESFGFAFGEGKGSGFGDSDKSAGQPKSFEPKASEIEPIKAQPQSYGNSKLNIYA
ncbi:MAG: flagellar hook-length control protein FliK [SAR324 cluster bacterium]|nr:flagellar hook-length control protein FliK [SAR324 cluster bacterium]